MTDKKEQTKAGATELTEEELGNAQGAGLSTIPIGGRGKKADGIIVVDEDGLSAPSDQYPGKK